LPNEIAFWVSFQIYANETLTIEMKRVIHVLRLDHGIPPVRDVIHSTAKVVAAKY